MVKIDGIDPLLLNRVREQNERLEVLKAESTATNRLVKREKGFSSQGEFPKTQASEERRLKQALDRLNDEARRDGLPLRFEAQRREDLWHVSVIDAKSREVLRDIPTREALQVVGRINNLYGLFLDQKR